MPSSCGRGSTPPSRSCPPGCGPSSSSATCTTSPTRPLPTSSASVRRRPRSGFTGPAAACGSGCSRSQRRRAPMQCEDVSAALPEIVDGAATADLALRRHVDTCLRCQAELAQYRKLLRTLYQLRTEVLEPAPGLLADILAKVEEVGEKRALKSLLTKRRVAYAGAIAATAAAGAAGAVIFGRRRLRAA